MADDSFDNANSFDIVNSFDNTKIVGVEPLMHLSLYKKEPLPHTHDSQHT